MNSTTVGMLILILAGVMNASFTLPMKFTRRWAWENTWLAYTIFALLVLPPVVTLAAVPHLGAVYHAAPAGIVLEVIGFGFGWGVSQVFFGLAAESIGIALTFSLVLGTSAAVGSVIPLLRLHPERLNTPAGQGVFAGVAMVLAGVFVCAIAGRQREKATNLLAGKSGSNTLGLLLAILSGLGAAFVNLGLTFGAPLVATAQNFGAGPMSAADAVWLPLMVAGSVPSLVYCFWLLRKNRTANRFPGGGVSHWVLAFIMACFWFFSTLLYGVSTVELGAWGSILGWPLFMSLIVITASLLGMITGEWKNSGSRPLRIQWFGVGLLVIAVFILAYTSRLMA